MKTLLVKIFIQHWPRKLIAIILAVILWLVVNHSLISTRTMNNIPVRIINIPEGKTVVGLQPDGKLAKKFTITLVGNRTILEALNSLDVEIVLDAQDKPDEWIAMISRKNLVSQNPEVDISSITRVYHPNFLVRMTNVITDQIPVIITQPIGEAPRGYQFLDVWPYRLSLTVTGPEELIKQLKLKEQRLTFNLNDISKAQLDAAASSAEENNSDVISFSVPELWKQLNIPSLSDRPVEINDPQAKTLRIDFLRCTFLAMHTAVPVGFYCPLEMARQLQPSKVAIATGSLIENSDGLYLMTLPLLVSGADRLFLKTVENMMQIEVILSTESQLQWSLQFINPRRLEDNYVNALMADVSDADVSDLQPRLRQEYLRNRFRSYMNKMQLFKSDQTRLSLAVTFKDHVIQIAEVASSQ